MIIWRGLGIVVLPAALVILFGVQLMVDGALGEDYYTSHGWPKLVGCSVAAVVMFGLGTWMNRSGGKMGSGHSLFFIPVQYWSVVLFLAGIYLMFA